MRQFDHPNVLSLIGISVQNNNPCDILPLMANKDLKLFLRAYGKVSIPFQCNFQSYTIFKKSNVLCQMCCQNHELFFRIFQFKLYYPFLLVWQREWNISSSKIIFIVIWLQGTVCEWSEYDSLRIFDNQYETQNKSKSK